ncbi:MAG: hypothetical protein KAJ51_03875 [Thermoplasmata archaeon]|nr:hypothetical protein [Thermoplasmata archaeon]
MPLIIDMGVAKGTEGEWVLMEGDRVIAHDSDMKKILKIAEKYANNENIVITKILSPNASFY